MLVPSDPLVAKKTELVWIESRFSFDHQKDANDDQLGGKTELGRVTIGRAYYAGSVGSAAFFTQAVSPVYRRFPRPDETEIQERSTSSLN